MDTKASVCELDGGPERSPRFARFGKFAPNGLYTVYQVYFCVRKPEAMLILGICLGQIVKQGGHEYT